MCKNFYQEWLALLGQGRSHSREPQKECVDDNGKDHEYFLCCCIADPGKTIGNL
jgi:hypothetical protein